MQTVNILGAEYPTHYAPTWWQVMGLSQTATGYGAKLNSGYKVNYQGRARRIYVMQYSNCGSAYILVNKIRVLCLLNHKQNWRKS